MLIGLISVLAIITTIIMLYAVYSMASNTKQLNAKVSRAEARAVTQAQTLHLIAQTSADPDSRTLAEAALTKSLELTERQAR